jgi:tetratricopeptide (TPR) repeat protein
VIHIAAHGSFVPGQPDCSGVLIGPGRFLTARTVGQMRAIPELVFLNCCHLGRVEELAQSTTIAQDLMGEGVRAVVAAGWAVDDAPAKRFAEVLFDDLLAGMLYGDAARHARNVVAQEFRNDDGLTTNTWGAYQCYGDPGFRLVTGRAPKQGRVEPVSVDDLVEAVNDVEIQAGDVRRTDAHHDARATLLGELAELAGVARDQGWDEGRLWYALGEAHFALRSFSDAVGCYERALERGGDVPIRLLERLANAQVRAARNLPEGSERQARFARAWENIERARRFGSSAERFALEGSYHKKRAVRLPPAERADAVRRAAAAYRKADEAEPRPYHALNWAQMSVVGGVKDRAWASRVEAIGTSSATGVVGGGYWDRAGRADYLLARAVVDAQLGQPDITAAVIAAYEEAFALRSTWANRSSALDHLQDLIDLHPIAAEVEGLRRVEAGLAAWAIADS